MQCFCFLFVVGCCYSCCHLSLFVVVCCCLLLFVVVCCCLLLFVVVCCLLFVACCLSLFVVIAVILAVVLAVAPVVVVCCLWLFADCRCLLFVVCCCSLFVAVCCCRFMANVTMQNKRETAKWSSQQTTIKRESLIVLVIVAVVFDQFPLDCLFKSDS